MRNTLHIVILLIILPFFSIGQNSGDTSISTHQFDSLKTEINRLKLYNKRLIYRNRILANLKSIDTSYISTDSIVISYLSKETMLLQRIVKIYGTPNCQAYENTEFYNDKGLVEYIEYWTCDCRTQKDVSDDEIIFERILLHFERFQYDNKGRISTRVFWYSSIGTRKVDYSYDENGQLTTRTTKILDDDFWN